MRSGTRLESYGSETAQFNARKTVKEEIIKLPYEMSWSSHWWPALQQRGLLACININLREVGAQTCEDNVLTVKQGYSMMLLISAH